MAHPYAKFREQSVSHSRVKKIAGRAAGGAAHSDAAADRVMIKKAVGAHDSQLHSGKHTDLSVLGKKSGGRLDKYARGGRTKSHKGNQVNIAIVTPQDKGQQGSPPEAAPISALPPPLPPAGVGAPLPKPPMMPPPGMGPGMGPGMPEGIMKPAGMMKRGGGVKMTAGAETGKGRLEKAAIQRGGKK